MSDKTQDRKLLELAAKAAGMTGMWFANTAPDSPMFFNQPNNSSVYGVWNPLTSDGDALRLAVKLNIDFYINHAVRVDYHIKGVPTVPLYEDIEPDPYAATRRAIVRAAAEIGKAKS